MLRERLHDSLRLAVAGNEPRRTAMLRLTLAAVHDRDACVRQEGNLAGLTDEQILDLLHGMIRQRRDSQREYETAGRVDLANQEVEEIAIIEQLLPPPMAEVELDTAVAEAVAETGATGLKDMTRVMARLRERHDGSLDMTRAAAVVRRRLD